LKKKADELEEAKELFEKNLEDAKEEKEGEEDAKSMEQPEFDEEEFNIKFDTENPPIKIPDEIEDDVDNDYDIIEEQEEKEE
jgi:hypothetical protein